MNVRNIDLEEMMCYAMRYAIGRRTYAVGDVCRFYLKRMNEWSICCLRQAIADIDSARFLGDKQIDMPEWLKLRTRCYDELLSRGYDEERLLGLGIKKEYTGENLIENRLRK